ncbi:MAG: hypothetical protein IT427_15645 [Pirellulales bacterium]|nr:hypothetical protein [Pirellulales bacterium]
MSAGLRMHSDGLIFLRCKTWSAARRIGSRATNLIVRPKLLYEVLDQSDAAVGCVDRALGQLVVRTCGLDCPLTMGCAKFQRSFALKGLSELPRISLDFRG